MLAGSVLISCGVLALSVAAAQEAPPAPSPDLPPIIVPAEELTSEPVRPPEYEDDELSEISRDPLAQDSLDDEPVENEPLQEIVLPSDRLFDDEDVYVDDLDPSILDPENQRETPNDRLRRLFMIYMNAVSDREFAEADTLAKQIVELTIEVHGPDSDELSKALTNLAIAQQGMKDFESSILNYNAAIGIIERTQDRLSSDLINPLRGLGAAHLAAGRPDLARESFDRAVHVSHVNSGPHNLEQVETLQSLAETYLAVGELKDAVDVQKRIYYLQARNIDEDSMDIIPALQTRAAFQNRMQLFEQQRYTLRRMISVIEHNKGKDSLDLIRPLTELGNSFLFVGTNDITYASSQPISVTSGEVYLRRAVRIAEAEDDTDWRIVMSTKLHLADYYVRSSRPNRGHRVYRDVWSLLSEDEERLALRATQMEKPVLLEDINPPTVYGNDAVAPTGSNLPGFVAGRAAYEYSVSTRGQATNIQLVDADPAGLDDLYEAVGRQLRRILHRPRFEEGLPVRSDQVVYEHSFLYRPDDLKNETAEPPAEAAESP